MDPISQGLLGASASQAVVSDRSKIRWVFLLGLLSGMAPDLDVLIRSEQDPLLFLDYHRQFSHSLVFIPVGGLICAVALFYFVRSQLSFRQTWFYASLGYATHGLLDACTSYGTQLFWPFSDLRVAWNYVSVIDPLFTVPMLVLVLLALVRSRRLFAVLALFYAVAYIGLGLWQGQRAETALKQLASERGHVIQKSTVKPTFGNLLLWKLVYEHEDIYFVDAVRLWGEPDFIHGESVKKLELESGLPWLVENSVHAKDIERFRHFSADYLALHPGNQNVVVDVRYSMLPNRIEPLWGISLTPEEQDRHVQFVTMRRFDKQTRRDFLNMLMGKK